MKEILSKVSLDKIYCSDLGRARQTAEIIASAHSILPTVCPELRELNMGDWEGSFFSEIRIKYPKEFIERGANIAAFSPPRGESFLECYKRVIPFFDTLTQGDAAKILIVGHAGLNRVILCHVLGIPLDSVFRLEQNYGCLNLICQAGSKYRLKYLNYRLEHDLYIND